MNANPEANGSDPSPHARILQVKAELSTQLIGLESLIDRLLTALLTGGDILIPLEGIGLGRGRGVDRCRRE